VVWVLHNLNLYKHLQSVRSLSKLLILHGNYDIENTLLQFYADCLVLARISYQIPFLLQI